MLNQPTTLLTPAQLHGYQQRAVVHQCTHPGTALFLDLGLGKTTVTLTSIVHLLNSNYLTGVLVIAPIRVIRLVWAQEAKKWSHTQHLRFSNMTGTKDQRTRALLQPADIYMTNYENLGWLSETLHTYFIRKDKPLPFNGLVWDELSKMKNSSTQRVKSFRKIADNFIWRTGLTGTPASNGYKDLHGQFLVLDGGQRLGTSKTAFKQRFYRKEGPYKEVAYADTESTITNLISDITLEMSADDYNKLPDLIVNDIEVELPPAARSKYDQLEKDLFTQLDNGIDVEVFNSAALTNKCLAEGTEVLTVDGWVKIENYKDQKVWDGVEWVSTSGLVYNGYMPIVECYGAYMTSDHRVLSGSGWVSAQDVIDDKSSKRYDRSEVRLPYRDSTARESETEKLNKSYSYMAGKVRLWQPVGNDRGLFEVQYTSHKILRMSSLRSMHQRKKKQKYCSPRDDAHTPMDNLAKYAITMWQPVRQRLAKLRWSWNQSVQTMAIVREILGRCWPHIPKSFDTRPSRREQVVQQNELPMGEPSKAGKQYTVQRIYQYSHGSSNRCASSTSVQDQTDHNIQTIAKGMDRHRRHHARVYDIANAGPRHRFVVRGVKGPFISHNCLQMSNGSVYPVSGMPLWEPVHSAKLDALEDIIDEAQGSPVLCSYAYRSDAERIMERFKALDPINLTKCKSESALNNAMSRWVMGDCRLMIGHAASMGHGVDGLQKTGHTVVWFGLIWSLELYEQMIGRLRRQGQGVPVICHRIVAKETMDQAQVEALNDKATTQSGLRKAISNYRLTRGM